MYTVLQFRFERLSKSHKQLSCANPRASEAQNPGTLFLIQSDFFVLQRTLTCPVQTSAAPVSTESKYSLGTALLPCPRLSYKCVLHVHFILRYYLFMTWFVLPLTVILIGIGRFDYVMWFLCMSFYCLWIVWLYELWHPDWMGCTLIAASRSEWVVLQLLGFYNG